MVAIARLARRAIDEHGAVQKEPELQALLDLLSERGIASALEIGSQEGGTLWALAHVATKYVASIDLDLGEALGEMPVPAWRVQGDSHEEETLGLLPPGEPFDFLLIDGDHSYEGVGRDYLMYAPLAAGGVVAFHDIVPHGNDLSEVDRFWREVKASWPGETREFVCPHAGDTWRGVVPAASCGIGVLIP